MKKPGKCGVIAGVDYQFPSGIALMWFRNGDMVYVESGTGLRALASCFGAHEGTGDLNKKIAGRQIRYDVDFMNVLEWFAPVKRGKREGNEDLQNRDI